MTLPSSLKKRRLSEYWLISLINERPLKGVSGFIAQEKVFISPL